ncbi:MAG: hypothetical protein HYZ23_04595 [Chloroflexi bacterium]|nr:hypothetical protein [Chloroflexota bacterium]
MTFALESGQSARPAFAQVYNSATLRRMNKHPFRVTLLLWLVLCLTAWNAVRLWTALAWQNTLNEFSAQPAPAITALSGGLWLTVGIVLAWGIWQKKAWARILLLGATGSYTVWYWSERLIWQGPRPDWLFAVVVNLAGIIFILFTTKSLTREAYERAIEHPKID